MSGLRSLLASVERAQLESVGAQLCVLGQQRPRQALASQAEPLLTAKEAAPYLGVRHPKTVERWVRVKGLPCVRIGRTLRFRLGDVLLWLAQRKEG